MSIKTTVTKKEKSMVSIAVVVDTKTFMAEYDKGLAKVKEVAQVDGFRKGHVPDSVLISKFGEMAILEEMADIVVQNTFAEAILDAKVDAIGRPSIGITKLAKDNDLEYTIEVAVLPTLTLPDYKKLASSVEKVPAKVEQKDIDDVVLEVRKMRAHKELHADGSDHDHKDEAHNNAHTAIDATDAKDLPELTDEYVKELGDFENVAAFIAKITENVTLEKEQRAKEVRRNAILEKIVSETKAEMPEVLVEAELDRMLSQMRGDVAQMGGTFEDYLTYVKKTESDIRKEWTADAEKRALIQILLDEIAKVEKIEANKESVEKEAQRLQEMYKEVDAERAFEYMNQMMRNEEVLKALEK